MEPQTNLIDIVIPLVLVVATFLGVAITIVLDIRHKMKQRRAAGFQPTDHAAGISGVGTVPPAKAAAAAPAWVLQEPDLLPAPKWLRMLNDQPDDIPHLMIIGPTGVGKTTFATAILSRRPGQVIVLSPKVKPSDWGGAPVISLDDSGGYGLLVRAVAALESERRRRLVVLRQGGQLTPLTIVLDEVPDLVDFVKGTGDLIRSIGGMGRELGIRMLLCSWGTLVGDFGLKGRGSARANYAQVVLTPQVETQPRGGVLVWGKVETALDLKLVKALAAQSDLGARGWAPPPTRVFVDEELPEAVVGVADRFSERETFPEPFPAEESPETALETFPETWKLLIAQGIGAGKTKSEIITGLPGYSGRKYALASAAYDSVIRDLGLVLESRE